MHCFAHGARRIYAADWCRSASGVSDEDGDKSADFECGDKELLARDEDDDEYGDKEVHARDTDISDYSESLVTAYCNKEIVESDVKHDDKTTESAKLTSAIDQMSARSAQLKEECGAFQVKVAAAMARRLRLKSALNA